MKDFIVTLLSFLIVICSAIGAHYNRVMLLVMLFTVIFMFVYHNRK